MYETLGVRAWYRHDVDVSLGAALTLAEFETERGIRSTYYLMPSCPFYTSEERNEAAAELIDLGHFVGVHLDPRNKWHYDARLLRSEGALRLSLHTPTADWLWIDLPGCEYAYSERWRGRYFSDSRGRFAHGDPEDFQGSDIVQINLHPEWWIDPEAILSIPDDLYERYFHESKALLEGAT